MTILSMVGMRLAEAFRRRKRLSASMADAIGAMFIAVGAKLAAAPF